MHASRLPDPDPQPGGGGALHREPRSPFHSCDDARDPQYAAVPARVPQPGRRRLPRHRAAVPLGARRITMMPRNVRVRAALILAAGCAALLAVGLDVVAPVRVPIVFGFVCSCPGLAWITLLQLREPLAEFVLGVTLSLV